MQVTSQVSASKVTHTLRQCKKYQLDQQYTGLIFFFLSFEKPDYSLKKAEFLTEKSFSSGIFFLNFQDLCRQISDLAYRDSPRFSQALDLLNASFLKEELTPVTHFHYSYRQILFGSEKLLLFLLLISPFLFRHTQTASFLQRYWPLFCAGFSLTAGVAALCWYSNYRFRQAVQLSSYRSILSEQTDPFSIRCAQDHFWGRQQVYLKNNADELSPICAAAFNFGIGTHWFILFLSHWNKWPRAGLFCWTPCMPNKIRFICKKSIGMRFRWIFGSFLRTVLLQPGKNRPFTALTPPIMRF